MLLAAEKRVGKAVFANETGADEREIVYCVPQIEGSVLSCKRYFCKEIVASSPSALNTLR